MIRSMTGFARVESTNLEPRLEILVRTVNHRFLELKIRTPPELEACDPAVRKLLKERVRRGQVQVNVTLRGERPSEVRLNRALSAAYLDAYRELTREVDSAAAPDLTALLRIPGVVTPQEQGWDEATRRRLETALLELLASALNRLDEERIAEGRGIVEDLRGRAGVVAQETKSLNERLGDLNSLHQVRLRRRLDELLGAEVVDEQRLLQEAALLADRSDVSEELQRLAAHADRLLDLLDQAGEVGKQIDFLAQEMNREANTLLSKTTSLGVEGLPVTEVGLRLKAEVEKIREQAQNLE